MLSGIMVGRLWGEALERPRRFIQVLMASSVHVGPLPSTMPDGGCLSAPLGVNQIVVSVTVTDEAVGAVARLLSLVVGVVPERRGVREVTREVPTKVLQSASSS